MSERIWPVVLQFPTKAELSHDMRTRVSELEGELTEARELLERWDQWLDMDEQAVLEQDTKLFLRSGVLVKQKGGSNGST